MNAAAVPSDLQISAGLVLPSEELHLLLLTVNLLCSAPLSRTKATNGASGSWGIGGWSFSVSCTSWSAAAAAPWAATAAAAVAVALQRK